MAKARLVITYDSYDGINFDAVYYSVTAIFYDRVNLITNRVYKKRSSTRLTAFLAFKEL